MDPQTFDNVLGVSILAGGGAIVWGIMRYARKRAEHAVMGAQTAFPVFAAEALASINAAIRKNGSHTITRWGGRFATFTDDTITLKSSFFSGPIRFDLATVSVGLQTIEHIINGVNAGFSVHATLRSADGERQMAVSLRPNRKGFALKHAPWTDAFFWLLERTNTTKKMLAAFRL